MKKSDFVKIIIVCVSVSAAACVGTAFINPVCSLICLLLSAVIISLIWIWKKRQMNYLKELNRYLSLVCSGDFSLNVSDNTEGELSILKNNIYKVVIKLKTTNEELKKEKLFLADSLADITHQLKTPLTSITVMTDLLEAEENSEKRAEFVDIIKTQVDKMNWLTATLLKLSKLDADTVEFNKTELSSVEIVNDCLSPFLLSLELKEIEIEKSVKAFNFTGDKNWTEEALKNIIKNCIEHSQSGGRLTVSATDTNIYSEFKISDTGCGIEKEDLPHIFDRFYHGKNSSSDSVGIGLALSKEILSKQNACVTVESEVGKGSTFTIKFYKSII